MEVASQIINEVESNVERQNKTNMSTNLFLSPSTNTALAHLISEINKLKRADTLAPVSILLPTAGAIHDLHNQLGDTIGVQMYQFYHLGQAVLDEAGIPIHEINDTAIRRLLRRILGELHAEDKLTTFAPVLEKPGFTEVMLDWVREMKSQGVFPEQYEEYAQGSGDQRDLQLAEIYTRYQNFMLQSNYSDADGLLWVTAEALEGNPNLFLSDGPMFIFGFDQFTPVQIRILKQLGTCFSDLNIYLLWDDKRSENSLALVRLQQTRNVLLDSISMEVVNLEKVGDSNPSLLHLHDSLFETKEQLSANVQHLELVEAPSREAEVRRAILEIKRLLIANVPQVGIAIVVPNPKTYLPIIRTVAVEYGVPVAHEHQLMENPAVATFTNLLRLSPDFPWQETFEALRSPYIRQSWLSDEQIELLDRLTRERPVKGGLDQWHFAVRPLEAEDLDAEDEDLGPPPLVSILSTKTLTEIEDGMSAFFDHLTPPKTATYREYTWWIQTAVIGLFPVSETPDDDPTEVTPTFDLLGCCQESPFPGRDLEALRLAIQALRSLIAASETVPVERVVAWENYRDELINLLRVMQIPPDPLQTQVRFGRLEEGRARQVDHLFVLGLSEGEFPTPPPADVFYSPLERETHPLPLMRYTPADDASLWWQVIGNVRQKLTLLRPYVDDNGAPWQPSPYWDAVRMCFYKLDVERIPIADHPRQEQAASQNELLVALAQSDVKEIPGGLASAWNYSQRANAIMQQIKSYQPPREHEGILQNAQIIDELAHRYGPDHVWSASRLNRYANCPYGFFAEYILKLEARDDPEEGIDAMQRGSILHSVLAHLYKRLADDGITLITPNLDTILNHLNESCDYLFPTAPQRYGFRPSALWRYEQEELHRMLRILVAWECEENGEATRYIPYLLEAGFGIRQDSLPPLEINVDDTRFQVRGLIDRLDKDGNGNLRVLDYKSGSTKYSQSDLRKGLALQTPLYALAAEQFLVGEGERVAESHYWHITIREASGSLRFDGTVRDHELAETAVQQAALNVERTRSGIFPAAPEKPITGAFSCRSYCDIAPICRVSRQSINKARRGGLA